MNAIATRRNGATVLPDWMVHLPGWIRYLVGAYPNANVSEITFGVLEAEFASQDAGAMMAAVKQHAQTSKWWPTVAELHEILAGRAVEEPTSAPLPFRQYVRSIGYQRQAVCPDCGEKTPDLDNCPFCLDITRVTT